MNKECDAPQMDNSTRQPQFLDDKATTTTTTTKDPGNNGQQQQQQQQKIETIVPPPAERQAVLSSAPSSSHPTEAGVDADACDKPLGDSALAPSVPHQQHQHQQQQQQQQQVHREERNAREKERSLRISQQINEIRKLLHSGGVIVPKGTKSSILSEAVNYINILKQHQSQAYAERQRLIHQLQQIGHGSMGQAAARAVRHVAAQNGVASALGALAPLPPPPPPPRCAPRPSHPATASPTPGFAVPTASSSSSSSSIVEIAPIQTQVKESEYKSLFDTCPVAMAIASLGGAIEDCNEAFSKLCDTERREARTMTIFSLIHPQDLQNAFASVSDMITIRGQSSSSAQPPARSCIFRGSMSNGLGLRVMVVYDNNGQNASCFCVVLVQNPDPNRDPNEHNPATMDCLARVQQEPGLSGQTSARPFTDQSFQHTIG